MKNTVVAALLLRGNKLLICQRKANGDFPGKWEFPGGKIESGESASVALRRELQEELGITAEIGEQVWRVEHQYPGHMPVLLLFFAVYRYEGTVENRVFEKVCWVAPEELPKYDFLEADLALIDRLAAGEVVLTS